MSKKRNNKKKKSNKKHNYNVIDVDVNRLNKDIMPIANDIKSKMDKLQERFNFSIDFAFPEITMEEITNFKHTT